MNQKHYPDLERCKKLTELGFPKTEHPIDQFGYIGKRRGAGGAVCYQDYVCPSVMEIMDVVLSNKIRVDSTQAQGLLSTGDYIRVSAFIKYRELDAHGIVADTYPNALADLIVWLVENGHLTFDKR